MKACCICCIYGGPKNSYNDNRSWRKRFNERQRNNIDNLSVPPAEKEALARSIESLLELLKQREQRIFDAASGMAFEACRQMLDQGQIPDMED